MARSFFERDEIIEGLTRTIDPQRQRATAKWRVLSQLAQGRSSENLPSSFGTDARSNFLDLLFGMEDLNQFDSPIELPPDSASTKILTEVASSTRRDEDVFNSMRRILGDPRAPIANSRDTARARPCALWWTVPILTRRTCAWSYCLFFNC
jgi:hypothetical protein